MGAALHDAAVLQHHDGIGVAHGGEAVRDDEGGPASHELVHGPGDDGLGAGVDGARGLVQNHRRRIGDGGADDFITRLPDGYDTMLTGNGAQLSQGQRQLISIARAAVADPPAMILDEATSSIDTRTEAIVQAGMDKLMEGRTTFVIAHRLSTVRNSDAIICLDHGRIIERGNHDELIAKRGYYYQLYTGAFELE